MTGYLYFSWLLVITTMMGLGAVESQSSALHYFEVTEPQVFRSWDGLSEAEKATLADQLVQIDLELLKQQKELILDSGNAVPRSYDSFDEFSFAGHVEDRLRGEKSIRRGEVGCLVLAGGQGTRLNYTRPKGTFPISVIKLKSLFQLIAEKVGAASVWAGRSLRLAIMTSLDNDRETREFFEQNGHFGLRKEQISFFVQKSVPLLDVNGNLFLKTAHEISMGADGNGFSIVSLAESGVLKKWRKEGIKIVNVILVDNPLADPFDPELAGFHQRQGHEITLKCTEKTEPEEKVGLLVKENGKCMVVEYSEMEKNEKYRKRPDGRLMHCCANLSLFCFSADFIERMAKEKKSIPLHKAWKAAYCIDSEGKTTLSPKPIAWKFETFIFDWLVHADQVGALLYRREDCFAPLKNATGNDSPETVRTAIQVREREILRSLGIVPPDFPFELAAEFYYPTQTLKTKWKNRKITTSYVK